MFLDAAHLRQVMTRSGHPRPADRGGPLQNAERVRQPGAHPAQLRRRDRLRGRPDIRHRLADQPAGPQRLGGGGAGGQGVRSGRGRGEAPVDAPSRRPPAAFRPPPRALKGRSDELRRPDRDVRRPGSGPRAPRRPVRAPGHGPNIKRNARRPRRPRASTCGAARWRSVSARTKVTPLRHNRGARSPPRPATPCRAQGTERRLCPTWADQGRSTSTQISRWRLAAATASAIGAPASGQRTPASCRNRSAEGRT